MAAQWQTASLSSPAAAASSAAILSRDLLRQGREVRAVDCKPLDEWHQVFEGADNRVLDVSLLEACPRGRRRRGRGLQPRRRHGRHGLHRGEQGALHALGAALDPRADRGPRRGRGALLLLLLGLRLRRREAGQPRRSRRCGRPTPTRRCPRTATAGRSSSASACAATSWRTSAWRPGSPATTTSTARGHLDRGSREGAGGDLPQGRRSRAQTGERSDRDLGRRPARPAASCISTIASRDADDRRRPRESSRSTSARPSW